MSILPTGFFLSVLLRGAMRWYPPPTTCSILKVPLLLTRSHSSDIRASCQVMKLYTGFPVLRSQRTLVALWVAMAIAAMSADSSRKNPADPARAPAGAT